ncbi:MAG: acyl-CoA dehydrogenase family protein [Sphingobium sp.]|nr:acyl-CoA/acyl-ACP dehydrogenase [Sphingobium sp.]MCP5398192.1 acyl-CoA/acyl-ACP dehydrogenase [Sphingomonas sp.]
MTEVTYEEREMLADAARAWVRQRAPTTLVRDIRKNHSELGYDSALFAEMAEMGWAGMLVPEEYGGHDFGFESMGMLVEELGRTLTPSPLIPSAVGAVSALILGGTEEQKQKLLPILSSGDCIGTLAIEEGRRTDLTRSSVEAIQVDNGWTLSGCKHAVEAGMAAHVIVVAAQTQSQSGKGQPGKKGITLFLCSADQSGIDRRPLEEADVRGRATITFNNVVVTDDHILGQLNEGATLAEAVLERTSAVVAAEMLGGATQAFETTIDYLKTRVQFGKLIGSFQALQHRAADMLGEIGLARAAVYDALRAIDRQEERAPLLASVAKIMAGKVFHKVAREMIQMHGGIGMTDEHDAGLYLKRAYAADMFCGNVAYHRERAARLIGV